MGRPKLKYSDVTPKAAFLNRREILAGAGAVALTAGLGGPASALDYRKSGYGQGLKKNSFADITSYNNFYEFGTGKEDPARHAARLTTDPWSVEVGGLVDKPGNYDLGDLIKGLPLEERIYRFRCVEAWSMVIPWIGFELGALLKKVGVQSGARYVAFETLYRPEEMIGQKRRTINWPYVEGLRMDEAMNPLTIMATGLYGKDIPKQNGAPMRLVVPWKYGFKSIKSIVKINLVSKMPVNTWKQLQSSEYGFYANVNPEVDHPRWSQATERLIGGGVFAKRQQTLMFNGYEKEVASMYAGMDLRKHY